VGSRLVAETPPKISVQTKACLRRIYFFDSFAGQTQRTVFIHQLHKICQDIIPIKPKNLEATLPASWGVSQAIALPLLSKFYALEHDQGEGIALYLDPRMVVESVLKEFDVMNDASFVSESALPLGETAYFFINPSSMEYLSFKSQLSQIKEVGYAHACEYMIPKEFFATEQDSFAPGESITKIHSCISIDKRPWYVADAPAEKIWLSQLNEVMYAGLITTQILKKDSEKLHTRPSLISQLVLRNSSAGPLGEASSSMDVDFIPQEIRVPKQRLKKVRGASAGRHAYWFLLSKWNLFLKTLPQPVKVHVRRVTSIVHIIYSRLTIYPFGFAFSKIRFHWFHRDEADRGLKLDIAFILKRKTVDRIQEMICCEIVKKHECRVSVHYEESQGSLPLAKVYFFTDFYHYVKSLARYPQLWGAKKYVLFTYTRPMGKFKWAGVRYALNQTNRVLSMSSNAAKWLIKNGVTPNKVQIVLGGANPEQYKTKERGSKVVGFNAACYPRKAPERMYQIIKAMPECEFILLSPIQPKIVKRHSGEGRWVDFARFKELQAMSNFTYVEVPYSEFADHYRRMDVFVSTTLLDGGPLSILEAMMSNAVPVASRAGFAEDLIQHENNGYLFDANEKSPQVCELIRRALKHKGDIRSTVEHLTWENYFEGIRHEMGV